MCVGALCCRSGDVCIAAAAKPGGSPPKILARVLACCGRFFELLLPEGAERMQRLRDEQQAQSPAMEVDAGEAGLNAMRRALAEVEKKEVPPWILARRKAWRSRPAIQRRRQLLGEIAVGGRQWRSRLQGLRLAWPTPPLVGKDAAPPPTPPQPIPPPTAMPLPDSATNKS